MFRNLSSWDLCYINEKKDLVSVQINNFKGAGYKENRYNQMHVLENCVVWRSGWVKGLMGTLQLYRHIERMKNSIGFLKRVYGGWEDIYECKIGK